MMVAVKVLLYIVEIAVCLLLGLIVMLQKPKEGGLGGAFGGGALEASLGADAGNILIKATAILGTIFLLNTLLLAKLTSSSGSVVAGLEEKAPTPQEEAAPVEPVPVPVKNAETAPVAPAAKPQLPAKPAAPAAKPQLPAKPAAPAAKPAAPAAKPAAPAPAPAKK